MNISVTRCSEILKEARIRFKKAHYAPHNGNSEANIAYRIQVLLRLLDLQKDCTILYADEAGLDTGMASLYGRAKMGDRVQIQALPKSKNISLCGLIGIDYKYFEHIRESYDRESFTDFFIRAIENYRDFRVEDDQKYIIKTNLLNNKQFKNHGKNFWKK